MLSRDSSHSLGIFKGRGHLEPFSIFSLLSYSTRCERDHKPVLDPELGRLQLCALTMKGMVHVWEALCNFLGSSRHCPHGGLGSSGPSAVVFTSLVPTAHPASISSNEGRQAVLEEKSLPPDNYSQSLKL